MKRKLEAFILGICALLALGLAIRLKDVINRYLVAQINKLSIHLLERPGRV